MKLLRFNGLNDRQRTVLALANRNCAWVFNQGRDDTRSHEHYEHTLEVLWQAVTTAHCGLRLAHPPADFDFFGLERAAWMDHATVLVQCDLVVELIAEPYDLASDFDYRMDRECSRLDLSWSRKPYRATYWPKYTETIVVTSIDYEEPTSRLTTAEHGAIWPQLVKIVETYAP
jgi:hypothetical protein